MMHTFNKDNSIYRNYEFIFWFLVLTGILLAASSYPMMKLGFDMWDHVDRIRSMVLDNAIPSHGRRYWYASWAYVFRLFDITDIFIIGTVVHRVQFIANCALIYFAAKQLFAPLLSLSDSDPVQKQWLSSLAFSSVLVWLTIIGTYSTYQQAWIMWYSVNYQITLSMLFLALGLIANTLALKHTLQRSMVKLSIAFTLLLGVLLFHAGELAYFVFYIPIIALCFGSKINYKRKYVLIIGFLIFFVSYMGIKFYSDQTPALITHFKNSDFTKIIADINAKGTWNVIQGGNRYSANWNELYSLSVFLFACTGFATLTRRFSDVVVDPRVMLFLLLSTVFCFLPTFTYTAGLLSLISYDGIVNRYYFASFVFLSLPLILFICIKKTKLIKQPAWLILLTLLCILTVFLYSKNINNKGTYYQNVKSIKTSLQAKKIYTEVNEFEIKNVRSQLIEAEKKYANNEIMYCGAYKNLFIAVYFLNRKNVFFERMAYFDKTVYPVLENCKASALQQQKTAIYIQ